jgi:hypothetical protein
MIVSRYKTTDGIYEGKKSLRKAIHTQYGP